VLRHRAQHDRDRDDHEDAEEARHSVERTVRLVHRELHRIACSDHHLGALRRGLLDVGDSVLEVRLDLPGCASNLDCGQSDRPAAVRRHLAHSHSGVARMRQRGSIPASAVGPPLPLNVRPSPPGRAIQPGRDGLEPARRGDSATPAARRRGNGRRLPGANGGRTAIGDRAGGPGALMAPGSGSRGQQPPGGDRRTGEVAAGSIAMGLGGYLAARGEADHYDRERRREEAEVVEKRAAEEAEVMGILAAYGVDEAAGAAVVEALKRQPSRWVDFMMRFDSGSIGPARDGPWAVRPRSVARTSWAACSRCCPTCSSGTRRGAAAVHRPHARRAARLRLRERPVHRRARSALGRADGDDRRHRRCRRLRTGPAVRLIPARAGPACRGNRPRPSTRHGWTARRVTDGPRPRLVHPADDGDRGQRQTVEQNDCRPVAGGQRDGVEGQGPTAGWRRWSVRAWTWWSAVACGARSTP
jgi:VIT family